MNDRQLLTSKALAGTMTTAKGRELTLAIYVNGVPLPKGVASSREGKAIGVVTIAGPLFRLTEERMLVLGPQLIATAAAIAETSSASPLFKRHAA